MRKKILMAAILAVSGAMAEASAKSMGNEIIGCDSNIDGDTGYHKPPKSPNANWTPKVTYNSASTALNVAFPANGQGGKVEIYRNGAKVIDATAAAGTNLSYMLRDYGNGSYIIVVSSGNTVVYSNNVEVRDEHSSLFWKKQN